MFDNRKPQILVFTRASFADCTDKNGKITTDTEDTRIRRKGETGKFEEGSKG